MNFFVGICLLMTDTSLTSSNQVLPFLLEVVRVWSLSICLTVQWSRCLSADVCLSVWLFVCLSLNLSLSQNKNEILPNFRRAMPPLSRRKTWNADVQNCHYKIKKNSFFISDIHFFVFLWNFTFFLYFFLESRSKRGIAQNWTAYLSNIPLGA